MEKPKPILENRSELLTTHPHLNDFVTFLEYFNKESDRGSVLVAATMIDDILLKILQGFLKESKSSERLTSGFNAPLGTFSSRIEATHAMGLITENEYYEINIIRKIRNDFAHGIAVSFDNQSLKDQCNNLLFSAKSYGDMVVTAKGLFNSAAASLILNLTNRPHYVSQKRLQSQKWPY